MTHHRSKAVVAVSFALGSLLDGCAVAEPVTASTPSADVPTARVIVRFRSSVTDPTDPAFLQRLARTAEVGAVDLVRPMSGDAFVMRVTCATRAAPATKDPCPAALQRLAATEVVLGIEVDGRVTHQ